MQIVRLFLIFVLIFQLISCATIINGSTEQVDVVSSEPETSIYVNDIFLGLAGPEAPLEVTISKKGRIAFVGKKSNCESTETVVRKTIDPTTFLGLLIDGGLVSILFVDILGTNAFVHADQKSYYLEMECNL